MRAFEERLGYPCDYRPQGYLFCATNEKHMAYLRANYEKQVAMGLKNVRLVARRRDPQHVSAAAR